MVEQTLEGGCRVIGPFRGPGEWRGNMGFSKGALAMQRECEARDRPCLGGHGHRIHVSTIIHDSPAGQSQNISMGRGEAVFAKVLGWLLLAFALGLAVVGFSAYRETSKASSEVPGLVFLACAVLFVIC